MFGQTWTLWQRLPPRYQLTARCFEEYPDSAVVSNTTDNAGSPRLYPSPRPQSASARDNSITDHCDQETVDKENNSEKFNQKTAQTASFPRRKSDYVSHFQTQRRVSSARRRLAEAPPQPSIHGPVSKSPLVTQQRRVQTAPAFPVTSPGFHEEQNKKRNSERYIQDNLRLLQSQERNSYKPRATMTDVFHFDDSKSIKSVDLSSDPEVIPKKYMVQETKDAIMYVDNGKVIYFRKSRHDLTSLLKTQNLRADRGTCFFAELRRDYLRHPKYGQKVPSDRIYKQSLTDPRVIASERMNYNDRLERILKYYSEKEEDFNSVKSSLDRSRPSSSRGSPIKGLSLTGAVSRPPSPSTGRPDSPNDYIRMHKRSKLHNRQFYLRTPSQQHTYSTKELESCRCCMCRVELQLALVTGIPTDIGLAATNARSYQNNPQSLKENLILNRSKSEGNANMLQTDKISHGTDSSQKISRVTFHQPEVTSPRQPEKPKEHTLTISCTLPEVTEGMSESGLDTARTSDVGTPVN